MDNSLKNEKFFTPNRDFLWGFASASISFSLAIVLSLAFRDWDAALHNPLPAFLLVTSGLLAFVIGVIIYCIQSTLRQAVKLKEQGQSLQESENRFQILLNGIVDYAIYMLDTQGYVKSWNAGAERIKQYKSEEILGKHFSLFYTAEDNARGQPANALSIAAATGKYVAEGWRVRKNGERFWASVIIDVLRNRQGELIGYAKITRDITHIKKAEEECEALIQKLVDSNNELERFAYIASHDLQEPLRLIGNFSALLKKDFSHEFSQEAQQYITIIDESAHQMHRLILDLLEYAHIGADSGHEQIIDVTQCIRYVTDILKIVIQTTHATISYDTFPPIKGNPVHFSTLLRNLIGNALKYQSKDTHPVIHIHAIDKGNEWLFCVKDNGIGMKPEYLQQIFEPFKRLHNKDEYFGTGMGLAICRKIVSKMGGHIWTESAPDAGSAFYFSLPYKNK